MIGSAVGEAWKPYLQQTTLSWCNLDSMPPDYLSRYAKSQWIQGILSNTGLAHGPEVRVLEAGCGTGLYSLSLGMLGFQVDAFDYNPEALRFARILQQKARCSRPDLSVRFFVGNLLQIGSEAERYDLVFNQAVLEYFVDAQERRQAIREMIRVTRKGGWVVTIAQHTGHPFTAVWRRLGWQGYTNQPRTFRAKPREFARELSNAGLSDIRVDGLYPWKALPCFWIPWYRGAKWSEDLVYLAGQALNRFVPAPRWLREKIGIQFLVAGKKT